MVRDKIDKDNLKEILTALGKSDNSISISDAPDLIRHIGTFAYDQSNMIIDTGSDTYDKVKVNGEWKVVNKSK